MENKTPEALYSFMTGWGENIKYFTGTYKEGMEWVKQNVPLDERYGVSPINPETNEPTRLKDIIIEDEESVDAL